MDLKDQHKSCNWDDLEDAGKNLLQKIDGFLNAQNESENIRTKL